MGLRDGCSAGASVVRRNVREAKQGIGTVQEYRTKSKKLQEAVTRLRANINTDGPTELTSHHHGQGSGTLYPPRTGGHWRGRESLLDSKPKKSQFWAVGRSPLGEMELRAIKTVAVEQWLKTLQTKKLKNKKSKPLAGGTREKIRDAMSSIFNHSIRWEFTDKNPITGPIKGSGVRVSAKRERNRIFSMCRRCGSYSAAFRTRERAMVSLDMTSGLRRGELAGLKWGDFDFENLTVE